MIDSIDQKILMELGAEARLTMTELAHRVGLSKTPVIARVKRLESEGYIEGYGARLNWSRLGRNHITYVELRMTTTREAALEEFRAAVLRVPEIVECAMIAGDFDYILKVRSRSIDDFRRCLGETISALPHVAATSTHVVMEQVKADEMGLPIGEG
ncbi:MAG: Lrp/AsnC ligand binding domain-containing protein [Mangrovicoccus sp.]|nr:Lrp/AsnC ligand binding domain-containing protein [Mangrovicoccus sp.]